MANNTTLDYCVLRTRNPGEPWCVVNNRKIDRPVVAEFKTREAARTAAKQMNAGNHLGGTPIAPEHRPAQLS